MSNNPLSTAQPARPLAALRSFDLFMLVCMLLLLLAAVATGGAEAGTGGTEFAAVYTKLTGWMSGTLGKILAVGMLLVGLAAGVVRGSLLSVVTGVGAALILANATTVIDGIVTATLPL